MTTEQHSDQQEWEQQQTLLSAAVDGEVSPDDAASLGLHLVDCVRCRRELDEMKRLHALLRALPAPVSERSFLLPLVDPQQSASTERPGKSPVPVSVRVYRRWRIMQWGGASVAAAGLAVALAGGLIFGGTSTAGYTPAPGQITHALPNQQSPSPAITDRSIPNTSPTPPAATPTPEPRQAKERTAASGAGPAVPWAGIGLGMTLGGGALVIAGTAGDRRRRRRLLESRD